MTSSIDLTFTYFMYLKEKQQASEREIASASSLSKYLQQPEPGQALVRNPELNLCLLLARQGPSSQSPHLLPSRACSITKLDLGAELGLHPRNANTGTGVQVASLLPDSILSC